MQSNSISFTSNIRLSTWENYEKALSSIPKKNSVNYPWTVNEIVKADKAFTKDICDCTAGGITDGKDVVMFHLCPRMRANAYVATIEKAILEKLDIKNINLKGFLVGSYNHEIISEKMFLALERFMKKYNIPCTMFRGHNKSYCTSVAYMADKDEWLVTNRYISSAIKKNKIQNLDEFLSKAYDEAYISPEDKVCL